MRKFLVFFTLALCLVFAAAAQADETKIGFFNIQEVIGKSDAYKAKQSELQKKFGKEGETLQKQFEAFQEKANKFQLQQQALSPDAREKQQADLMREKLGLDEKAAPYMRKRQTAEAEAEQELNKIIFYAVQEYGKREKYTAIMEQSGSTALYVDQKCNLNDAILKEVNKVWKEKPKAVFGDNKK